MIFCRTKRAAARVADELTERGFAVAALHGDLGQGAREQALRAFRNGKVDVLVATDVAARGIDVDDVTHVINYQCPEDEKVYIHRIGRTGRAGNSGTAVTFVDWDDVPRWSLISKALGAGRCRALGDLPHLAAPLHGLDIPEDVTGRLPRAQRTREGLSAEKIEDLGGSSRGGRGRGRGGRSSGRSGGRGERPTSGERTHTRRRTRKDGDQTLNSGKQGRSDRGTKGRGRGEHSPAPRKRVRRRKAAEE